MASSLDTNSAQAWDAIWRSEGGVNTWRQYPSTFRLVCDIVGSDKSVLEVGCGVGILLNRLHAQGNNVQGLDISPFAVKTVKATFRLPCVTHDMRSRPTPFHASQFDFVVATEFLEHLHEGDETERVLSEIARIGRSAIFCVPNGCLPNSETKEHHQVFYPDTLLTLLQRYYMEVHLAIFIDEFRLEHEDGTPAETIALPTIIAQCHNRV